MATALFAIWLIGALLMIAVFLLGKSGRVKWLKARSGYADPNEEAKELIVCAVMWPVLLALGGIEWGFGKKDEED